MADDEDVQLESFASFIAAASLALSMLIPQPVRQAINLLPSDVRADIKQVQVLAPKSNIHVNSKTECQAWVKTGDPNIYIHNWTDTYRRAEKGDHAALVRLAAAIAHEAYHQKHGPAEGPAYEEQLRILKLLGADQKDIKAVQASRDYVMKEERLA